MPVGLHGICEIALKVVCILSARKCSILQTWQKLNASNLSHAKEFAGVRQFGKPSTMGCNDYAPVQNTWWDWDLSHLTGGFLCSAEVPRFGCVFQAECRPNAENADLWDRSK